MFRKKPMKRTKAKKPKYSAKWYVDRLDEMARVNVHSRGRCEAEGMFGVQCSDVLHCHHISRRKHYINRWEESNLICLCARHHFYIHDHSEKEVELVNTLWEGAEYEIDGFKLNHQEWLTRRESMKWDKDYAKLFEYWLNKPERGG
jgi:hypothetical protein